MSVSPTNSLAEFKKQKLMREKWTRQRNFNEILNAYEVESESEDFPLEAFQHGRRSQGVHGETRQEQTQNLEQKSFHGWNKPEPEGECTSPFHTYLCYTCNKPADFYRHRNMADGTACRARFLHTVPLLRQKWLVLSQPPFLPRGLSREAGAHGQKNEALKQ